MLPDIELMNTQVSCAMKPQPRWDLFWSVVLGYGNDSKGKLLLGSFWQSVMQAQAEVHGETVVRTVLLTRPLKHLHLLCPEADSKAEYLGNMCLVLSNKSHQPCLDKGFNPAFQRCRAVHVDTSSDCLARIVLTSLTPTIVYRI